MVGIRLRRADERVGYGKEVEIREDQNLYALTTIQPLVVEKREYEF